MQNLPNAILEGPTHYATDHHFSSPMTLIFVLAMLFAGFILAYVIIWILFCILRFYSAYAWLGIRFLIQTFDTMSDKDYQEMFDA